MKEELWSIHYIVKVTGRTSKTKCKKLKGWINDVSRSFLREWNVKNNRNLASFLYLKNHVRAVEIRVCNNTRPTVSTDPLWIRTRLTVFQGCQKAQNLTLSWQIVLVQETATYSWTEKLPSTPIPTQILVIAKSKGLETANVMNKKIKK